MRPHPPGIFVSAYSSALGMHRSHLADRHWRPHGREIDADMTLGPKEWSSGLVNSSLLAGRCMCVESESARGERPSSGKCTGVGHLLCP